MPPIDLLNNTYNIYYTTNQRPLISCAVIHGEQIIQDKFYQNNMANNQRSFIYQNNHIHVSDNQLILIFQTIQFNHEWPTIWTLETSRFNHLEMSEKLIERN